MKKIVSLGLAAAMAASVLTGCGGGSAQTADTKADAKTEEAKGSEAASDKAEGTATAEGMTAVSYTHLDVYKRQIVDSFNSIANVQGQMDWGLAYHPYPCPMIEPEFWDDPKATGLFTNDFNSPVINFSNLNVLTDYFNQEALKAPSGNVRHIILTEQGFTSYLSLIHI